MNLTDEAIAILDSARVNSNTVIAKAIFDIGMNFLAVQEESPISDWTDFLAQDPGAGDWDAKMSEQRLKYHPAVREIVLDIGAAEYRGFHVLRIHWGRDSTERWLRGVSPAYIHLRQGRFATEKEFYADDLLFCSQDVRFGPRRVACLHPR